MYLRSWKRMNGSPAPLKRRAEGERCVTFVVASDPLTE